MLFGRGNWAILGLNVESFPKFVTTFVTPKNLFGFSQLVATIGSRMRQGASIGINPFGVPRKDEAIDPTEATVTDIYDYLQLEPEFKVASVFEPSQYAAGYGADEQEFILSANTFNTYGFWVVFNDYDDVSDLASKKEQMAYESLGRPFKFATKDDKTRIEVSAKGVTVPIRKQFPVIVDYQTGRVFIASTNKDEILAVRSLLTAMGADLKSVYWSFGKPEWPRQFLTKVDAITKFSGEFRKRAEERQRFDKKEIEALEDKSVERIVNNFYAMSELPTGEWAGLKTPTRIKLSKTGEPLSFPEPTMVTTVKSLAELGEGQGQFKNEFEVIAAGVVFQEVYNRVKDDKDIVVRKDLFTITVDDNINSFDAGAALLKGFDLPKYKGEMKKFLKAKGQAEIKDYWYQWVSEMRGAIEYFVDNVLETLSDGDEVDTTGWGLKEAAAHEAEDGQADISDIAVNV